MHLHKRLWCSFRAACGQPIHMQAKRRRHSGMPTAGRHYLPLQHILNPCKAGMHKVKRVALVSLLSLQVCQELVLGIHAPYWQVCIVVIGERSSCQALQGIDKQPSSRHACNRFE